MRKILLVGAMFALSMAANPASAKEAAASAAVAPKLIVAIAVDQFSSDLFNEYRGRVTGGLARLGNGVVFARGHQSHAATETCPGHSTILTGSRPARTGIIANDWQNPRAPRTDSAGKASYEVYCAEDASLPGSNSGNYTVSPHHLKVPTLGDRMKRAFPGTRVVAVSGKDRAAVMMGGHDADLEIWWDGKSFTSYKDRLAGVPAGLAAVNARATAAIAKPVAVKLPTDCAGQEREIAISPSMKIGRLALRKAGDERGWRATPEFDALTLDATLAAFNEMKLGRGSGTDVLAVSFSATDYAGHGFGTEGPEMCAQIHALDATLGRLFAALDKAKMPYAVVLTADHGGHDAPERNREDALPSAQRVDAALSAKAVGAALAPRFGLADNALLGRSTFGDIYLSPAVPVEKRADVLQAAVSAYRQNPQVAAVFTAADIAAAPAPSAPVDEWSLLDRVKAGFDPERSGDFVVLLKPYVTPIPAGGPGFVATHGSPWGYDRRVPILFWWKGMTGFEQPNAVETVDILPTLASLIGLDVPSSEIDGRCLDLIAGGASNCR